MTWKEAITKVLLDEGAPLHYTDITNHIFENGYKNKKECGATPEQTVCAQLATKKKTFRKLGNGIYELIDTNDAVSTDNSHDIENDNIEDEEELIQRNNIIKNFGMYWNRAEVNWKTMNLYGIQNALTTGSAATAFERQTGI